MKKTLNFCILISMALLVFVACYSSDTQVDEQYDTDSLCYYEWNDDCEKWQDPYPELTAGQLRMLKTSSIANGDKETFAKLVKYPLKREYPLPSIKNEQEMIDYFDILFDNAIRDTLRNLDSNSWEEVGWRGVMVYHGMLWNDGPIDVINYTSPQEEQLRQKLIREDISALHPSLQGPWVPKHKFRLSNKKYGLARIDYDTTNFENSYRLTIFKKGSKVDDIPALILTGYMEVSGSIGYTVYYFKNKKGYKAVYNPDYFPSDTEQEKWANFKPAIELISPKKDTTKLIIR